MEGFLSGFYKKCPFCGLEYHLTDSEACVTGTYIECECGATYHADLPDEVLIDAQGAK